MIGLQMFSTYQSSYMQSAAQTGEVQSGQKPPQKDEASDAEAGKRPPPPEGGGIKPSGAASGQDMSGRFMMMSAEGTESGGKPKPSAMVADQLSEAGIDISSFDAKAFDEAIGSALSELSSKPDAETMEEILLSALEEQDIDIEGLELELPEKGKGDRPPPPPMGGMQGSGGSSQNAQQQAVLALFQTNSQMTVTNTVTTSFYA